MNDKVILELDRDTVDDVCGLLGTLQAMARAYTEQLTREASIKYYNDVIKEAEELKEKINSSVKSI